MLLQEMWDSEVYRCEPVDRIWNRNWASTLCAPDILVTMGGATSALQPEREGAVGQGKSGPIDLSYF